MKKILLAVLSLGLVFSCSKKDGEYSFHLLTTGDCHGAWFSQKYDGEGNNPSLFAVKSVIDSFKLAYGKDYVIAIDGGDGLQGDEAAYYYNYVKTEEAHLFPEILARVGFDAAVVGNHDIETGHPVYDRLKKDFKESRLKWLGGNAFDETTGKPYFDRNVILKRNGFKIAILGYTNPNISEWLREELWSGIRFESLLPLVQNDVDEIVAKEHPDIVIVAAHSGIGKGNGKYVDNQGLDLFNSLKGVDFVVCAHDHQPKTMQKDDMGLLDSGSKSKYVGHGTLNLKVENGKIVSKSFGTEVLNVDKDKIDNDTQMLFADNIDGICHFANKKVGTLTKEIRTRDAYAGMSDGVNLINYVCLKTTGAQVSFAAPLSYDSVIPAGELVYRDMSTLYQYENQLYKISMKGREIVKYLECSYDKWIQNPDKTGHVLKIVNQEDLRNEGRQWKFVSVAYNFDSAAGICYTVDVTKPYGERVSVTALADGTRFDMGSDYSVAINSYRASGAGGILSAAGVDSAESRMIEKYPEIRNLIYKYIKENGVCDPDAIAADPIMGNWLFVPEIIAKKGIEADMGLLFGE